MLLDDLSFGDDLGNFFRFDPLGTRTQVPGMIDRHATSPRFGGMGDISMPKIKIKFLHIYLRFNYHIQEIYISCMKELYLYLWLRNILHSAKAWTC